MWQPHKRWSQNDLEKLSGSEYRQCPYTLLLFLNIYCLLIHCSSPPVTSVLHSLALHKRTYAQMPQEALGTFMFFLECMTDNSQEDVQIGAEVIKIA
jgi:hypothetical protein